MDPREAIEAVHHRGKILLTGSTGYIGGHLLRRLEADSYPIRCLVRRLEALGPQIAASTEVAGGDLLKPETLPAAMRGITTAYDLVHSMASEGDYAHQDRTAAKVFSSAARDAGVRRIGGEAGWYGSNWLWRVRGALDLLAGGPGMQRGRKDAEHPAIGETIDFWRVQAYEENRLLRLKAEMRLPGRAWLQFEVEPHGSGSWVRQTAEFDPLGFLGLAYWYGLYPLHYFVFARLLRGIAFLAVRETWEPRG